MRLRLMSLIVAVAPAVFMTAPPVVGAEDESARANRPSFTAGEIEFFEKKVRPLLVRRCYKCHGPNTKEPKGGLRVDSRESLLEGGDTDPAIVPGKPAESLLVDAINYGDSYQMPPKSKLPAEEIKTLTQWVKMGAPWSSEKSKKHIKKVFELQKRRAEHWAWR